MILVEDKIEKMTVTVEIDENGDHRKWSGCPELVCDGHSCLFESVDALTVIKAVKTAETVEEFIEKVGGDNTWQKEKLARPIIEALNAKAVKKVEGDAVKILDFSFSDDNKELFEFNEHDNQCLNCCFNSYANNYDGRFDKLGENEQVRYLVQSALADC